MIAELPEILSDILPYLCAVLGLLLVWQYHEKQVLAGRIQAIDVFDRSGVRMYILATPADDEICEACRESHGMVFLPSRIASREFSARRKPCTNSGRCTVVVTGLYGAWLQGRKVVQRLREAKQEGLVRLSPEELEGLIQGNWEDSVSAATDRLAVMMLMAMNVEIKDPKTAIDAYRTVIEDAKGVHDLPLVVPAYLRLVDVLVRENQTEAAMQLITEFEARYPRDKSRPYYPKETQRGLMAIKKSRLKSGTAGHRTEPKTAPPLAAAEAASVPHAS